MAKSKSSFICQACGAVTMQWQGRCDACGEWNTIVEEITDSGVGEGPKSAKANGRPTSLVPLSGETESAARVVTGLGELDRVTGGGFVKGSALLVGGDPGIGKSTLLLQSAADLFSAKGYHVLRWRDAGMAYWAVSDVNEPDLKAFAEAYASAR